MSEFKAIVGNFIIAALMIVSLFSFSVVVQEENNAVDPLKNNQVFNESFSGLINTLNSNSEAAEEKYDVFNSEDPKPGFGSIVLFGIVSVGKTFSGVIFGTFGAIIKLPLIVLGIPATIYSQIIVLLIIIVIVSVWLLYKLGG